MFTRCDRCTRQKTLGSSRCLQLVERPVVRRAGVLARDDRDRFVGQRRINDLFRLHEQEPFADLDRQPLAPALALGDELDDLLELLGG